MVPEFGPGLGLNPASPDAFKAGCLGVDVRGHDVKVHPVLGCLGFRDALEEELGQRPGR